MLKPALRANIGKRAGVAAGLPGVLCVLVEFCFLLPGLFVTQADVERCFCTDRDRSDGKIPNCLPIVKGWNHMVRLYRPGAEVLNGRWQFPEAKPAN